MNLFFTTTTTTTTITTTATGITGGRGIAGTVLVHKIAGATAASGASIDVVQSKAQAAADSCGTMGVALSTCCVPGRSTLASKRLKPIHAMPLK